MATPTGFFTLDGTMVDLATKYEPRTSGATGTTNYFSQAYNKDLGAIFYLNANLAGLGFTGTTGSACGYRNSSGVDIGTLFCVKGSVGPLFSGILNGGFTSPNVATLALYSTSPYEQITNWTYSLGQLAAAGEVVFLSKAGAFTTLALPTGYTQFFGLQNQINGNNMNIHNRVAILFPVGNYTLNFYMSARNDAGTYNDSITMSVYLSTSVSLTNGLPISGTSYLLASGLPASTTAWELKTINFSIPTSDSYYLFFVSRKNSSTNYGTILLTGVAVRK